MTRPSRWAVGPALAVVVMAAASESVRPRVDLAVVESFPSEPGLVLDVVAEDDFEAVATKGGGAAWGLPGREPVHWGLGEGLGSGVARFVRHDRASGRVYVGTDRGVSVVDPANDRSFDLVAPAPSPATEEFDAVARLGPPRRAGPAASSGKDGRILFQIQGTPLDSRRSDDTALLTIREGRLAAWTPAIEGARVVALSSVVHDPVGDCWLAGGWIREADSGEARVAVVQDCERGKAAAVILPSIDLGTVEGVPQRVVAIAPGGDALGGATVVALEFEIVSSRGRERDFGIYRLQGSPPELFPAAPGLGRIGSEVTSLARDPAAGRLFAGAFGRGIVEIRERSAAWLELPDSLPREVSALAVSPRDASLLVGTAAGPFRWSIEDGRASPWLARPAATLPLDALPTDVHPTTGRVLLSSYRRGIFEIERDAGGAWRVARAKRAGAGLPEGLFGEARYGPGGVVWAIAYGLGLLRVEGETVEILGRDAGLAGTDLLAILPRSSGDVWVAHTPVPFGSGPAGRIQVVKGRRVASTRAIHDRDLATVTGWIDKPGRRAVWAATRAGVVEMRDDGERTRLTRYGPSAIAAGPAGDVGVVGPSIERWDGTAWSPVLFRPEPPDRPGTAARPGPALDLAIDGRGDWFVLFRGGVVAWLDAAGNVLDTLDARDGIPPSALRILAHPASGDLVVGSANEGVAIVRPVRAGDRSAGAPTPRPD